jgi:hypothetical protein
LSCPSVVDDRGSASGIGRQDKNPDFLYAGPSNSRMKRINANKLHRKTGKSPLMF